MTTRKPPLQRSPQLALRLDAAPPDPGARWRDGATFPCLGGTLCLCLSTDRESATRDGDVLHLPLPPGASARQIQDGVEAWLRQEATRVIGVCVSDEIRRLGRGEPAWALSFAVRGGSAQQAPDGSLRFNWRLIEQPQATIEQVVAAAVAALPVAGAIDDLWA